MTKKYEAGTEPECADDVDMVYARRRLCEMHPEELRALYGMFSDEEVLQYLCDEFWDLQESPEDLALEDAEIEWFMMGCPKDRAH